MRSSVIHQSSQGSNEQDEDQAEQDESAMMKLASGAPALPTWHRMWPRTWSKYLRIRKEDTRKDWNEQGGKRQGKGESSKECGRYASSCAGRGREVPSHRQEVRLAATSQPKARVPVSWTA